MMLTSMLLGLASNIPTIQGAENPYLCVTKQFHTFYVSPFHAMPKCDGWHTRSTPKPLSLLSSNMSGSKSTVDLYLRISQYLMVGKTKLQLFSTLALSRALLPFLDRTRTET